MLLPIQIAYSWGLCRLAFSDYPGLLVCFTCFLVIRVISLEFVNTHNFSFFLAYHSGGNTKFRLTPSNLIEIGKQVWSQWHHPRKQSEKVLPISVNRFMVLKPSSLAVHFPIKLPFLSCSVTGLAFSARSGINSHDKVSLQ